MRSQLRQELRGIFGPRRFIGQDNQSDRVGLVLPETLAEVQQIARLTRNARVPLIPRGATTNSFAGPEPKEGLVVSFERLSRIGAVNARARVVTVEPGVIWRTLIEPLAPRGLMPRVYPSSEGFSTVGGFVAQGGLGIGSYQFGEAGQSVAAVRLVDANGELRQLVGDKVGLVVGAQGRTGLVVEVKLRLQELVQMTQLIALFQSFEAAEQAIVCISEKSAPIWSVNVLDPMGAGLQSRNWPELAIPSGKYAVLFTFRERDASVVGPAVKAITDSAGGERLEPLGDASRWLVQFASLQAVGTTPVPMQFQVPLGRAAEMVGKVPPKVRNELAIEAVVGERGKSMAVRWFFTERQTAHETNLRVARDLLALAKELGGTAYNTGSVYLDEAETVFGAERLRELAEFRKMVDPDDRLNPGRAFRSASTA